MRHLQAGPAEATLDIESLICLAAVQYTLVAPNLLGDKVKSLDDPQSQLLALLVLGYGNIFDVTNYAQVMDAVE